MPMEDKGKGYKHEHSAAQKISKIGSFVAGSLAACLAVIFTNPIETVKTRMQLQGEMSGVNERAYRNVPHALGVIYKNEGIHGLQKGLNCAYFYQIALNGSRLGFYEPIRSMLNGQFFPGKDPRELQNMYVNIAAGATSGIIGAVTGSPLYLVKTRMQSYSPVIRIGQQTQYSSPFTALRTIAKKEGIRGLYRGVDAAIIRTGIGSSVQLPVYNLAKRFLIEHDFLKEGTTLHLTASVFSGIGCAVVMNPWDVILTRVSNQRGNLYKGPIDCFYKTLRIEGVTALYKGFSAQLFRICPHTILCLTFMEQTMKLIYSVETRLL
ncbi:HBL022Wp [Eremothecium sinecaudum]|uniref:Mitochondrial oxaloacetate transport protein n=1 Tax=Eremothecium sinecaudum TaxID=45286 RepID=A0A125RDY0_9SACH|nr:HBL022Wp [Eremothecium sinecaudum]AMD18880.1 HBL022Wp [Eremothecium sinecaudum]